MARYSKEHRAETRETIIKAASELLREKGFDGFGVADVMAAVGLTHGGFYAHFADKQALLDAALAKALQQSPVNFARLATAALATNDAGTLAARYLDDARIANVAGGCATAALASELHRQPASASAIFVDASRATVEAIEAIPGVSGKGWAILAMLAGAKAMMRAIPEEPGRSTIRNEITDAIRQLAKVQP
ncbi:MAG: hypothetical protein B7Y43_15170 [Sphingomonas sp. 28-62-20]|uniref:TetR/AcrR family transcriptional regulator n=1 Tax=Sphingomonas sp. 28-62-20 TaxID=1970433 RepID=UPI000BCB51DF|nr:MAG: hypothetical protein B7Y43_15170 [Sphingomonas sp. 28-62-20]